MEERLECFKILKYDIEAERIPRPAQGEDNKVQLTSVSVKCISNTNTVQPDLSCHYVIVQGYSRTRDLDSEQLLEQLPSLQQLLYRLMGCRVCYLFLFI